MRTWGASGAGAALRRAQVASAYARRRGCGVDEADELVHQRLSRRQFLVGAGAMAASTTALWASPAAADPRRSAGRSGRGRAPRPATW